MMEGKNNLKTNKMQNANIKIQKLPHDSINRLNSIQVKRNSGQSLGLILASGEFIPVDGAELYTSEMLTIVNVMKNFPLFFDNVEEVK